MDFAAGWSAQPHSVPRELGRATAGQLRRAGFAVVPESTPNDATTGFDVLCHHCDDQSKAEHSAAVTRGDAFLPSEGKKA